MRSYILQRIIRTLFTFLVFETLLFFFIKAIPGKNITISPPQPSPENPISGQTQQAGDTQESKPADCGPIPTPPKWLSEDDKAKYLEDIMRERILKGCQSGEVGSQAVAPVSTPAPVQQPPDAQYVPENPSTFQQYIYWLQGLLKGDLGVSTKKRMPVIDVLFELAPRTLILILPGALIGFFLGLRLGIIASWKRGGTQEFATTVAGVTLFTAFPPFLSFLLASIFAYYLNWLPRENIISPDLWLEASVSPNSVISWMLWAVLIDAVLIYLVWHYTRWMIKQRRILRATGLSSILILTFGWWIVKGLSPYALDILLHLILPLTTLILLTFGTTMLLMRASMTEVLKDVHVMSAKAKGLPDAQVRNRHVARLALIPVISRFILELPLVIISSFAVERVFYWNGLGQFLFEAANESDYPLVLGILTVVGVVILAAHFFVDMLNLVLDPRLRKGTQKLVGG